jgi:hypothetical protein
VNKRVYENGQRREEAEAGEREAGSGKSETGTGNGKSEGEGDTGPGATAFTLIPFGVSCFARDLVKETIAPFVAA